LDERVAREVRHQELIEASFDRAEAYEHLGDFEHALEWLDRAAKLSGGLPAAYRARRARWERAAAVRLRPIRGG
jgi:tetratricopeptide (TPR) repeat protein